jgi:tRNA pseudouridine38-40 synthase
MLQRLKLIVAYDGPSFGGWQSQAHRNTVQDHLERALHRISGTHVRVHGAGRTDAGVHALAQCAHADVPRHRLPPERWTNALNALLPPTIRVLRCRFVSASFHARFSAKGKVYRYRIWSAPIMPPLEFQRAWHVPREIDFDLLKTAAGQFIGVHDFAAFAVNRGHPVKNTVRNIHSAKVRRKGPCITVELHGDGFLYKMARLMVGEMMRCAAGDSSVNEMEKRLASGRAGGARLVAPADGLYLVRVRY